MEQYIPLLINALPSWTVPIVIVVLGCYYIYKKIGKEREITKELRDKDSSSIHDDILKLKFKVSELDGRTVKHEDILNDLRDQVSMLNTHIAVLGQQIETLVSVMKEQK